MGSPLATSVEECRERVCLELQISRAGRIPYAGADRKAKGTPAALQRYAELKKSAAAEYQFEERTLNALGYTLLFSGQVQDAITVFQRNVEEYPQSAMFTTVWAKRT